MGVYGRASLATVDIAVVGSLNMDTTVRVPRLPQPGETVLATGRFTGTGGKGANQAIAAARLGRSVAMIGLVGDDAEGSALQGALEAESIDASGLGVTVDAGSGLALITVDEAGENMIVVDPGANALMGEEQVIASASVLGDAAVVLAQLEIPLSAVAAAIRACRGVFVLNPAPAAPIPQDLLAEVAVLVPNATELAALTGGPEPESAEAALDLAATLEGPSSIVVTLSSEGAAVLSGGHRMHVPAPVVTAVDPTAAGDAFCGGLADALVDGADIVSAVEWAVRCGAVAATRWGAQASLPTRAEVEGSGNA